MTTSTKKPVSFIRILLLFFIIIVASLILYIFWSPGLDITDGRNDLSRNGIWLQHGWLGDNSWFKRYKRDKSRFRSSEKITSLLNKMKNHGIKYLYPHLCPCSNDGRIAAVDNIQTARFLDLASDFKVIPWVGGVFQQQCLPSIKAWRENFTASVIELLVRHPRLAGIQLNIEPMPSGNPHFIMLLKELKQKLPKGKILSVAAYPPPTKWHPVPQVHWDEDYFRQVAENSDQMAVMMYDTAIKLKKPYQKLMADWSEEVIKWSPNTEVLLGLPTYDDAGKAYHDPRVENLANGLKGIHAGLKRFDKLPPNYSGIAIYCEWEMDDLEWNHLKQNFLKTNK